MKVQEKHLHIFFLLSVLLVAIPLTSFANPVSFKGGWGIMPAHMSDWTDIDINYSLSRSDAIGLSYFYRDGADSEARFGIARYNRLLMRWNEHESQANIYVMGGIGGRSDNDHNDSIAGYGGIEADYETRQIYSLVAAETLQSPAGVHFNRLRGRLGFSPYKAGIDSIQTWLIAQIDYSGEMEDETEITPMVRLFIKSYALEFGLSVDGKVFLAAMAHF